MYNGNRFILLFPSYGTTMTAFLGFHLLRFRTWCFFFIFQTINLQGENKFKITFKHRFGRIFILVFFKLYENFILSLNFLFFLAKM